MPFQHSLQFDYAMQDRFLESAGTTETVCSYFKAKMDSKTRQNPTSKSAEYFA